MPKRVDHDQRRRELVDALWRVVARDGFGAVSFREVAAEAEVSVRRVQYYFGTKDQLLLGALMFLGDRIVARGLQRIADAGPDPSPEAIVRSAVFGAQPHDDDSRRDLVLFFSFYVAGLTDPALGNQIFESQQWLHPFMTEQLQAAVARKEAQAGVDPELEAAVLLAVNSGFALMGSAGVISADDATAALNYYFSRVFSPKR